MFIVRFVGRRLSRGEMIRILPKKDLLPLKATPMPAGGLVNVSRTTTTTTTTATTTTTTILLLHHARLMASFPGQPG